MDSQVTVKVRRTEEGFSWDVLGNKSGPSIEALAEDIGNKIGDEVTTEQAEYLGSLEIGQEGELGFQLPDTSAKLEDGDTEDADAVSPLEAPKSQVAGDESHA